MGTKSAVDLMESLSEVHFSGFHIDGLEQRKAGTEQPTTSTTDMYKQPFVIGVCFCIPSSLCSHKFLICLFVSWNSMFVLGTFTLSCVCWVSSNV